MSQLYSRPLDNPRLVQTFFENVLKYDYSKKGSIVDDVWECENSLKGIDPQDVTLENVKYRANSYTSLSSRWNLRRKIIEELFTLKRLESDDDIKLGRGGALPISPVKSERQAYILIGLPASGKSSVANHICESTGSVIIDSDYAKRKFPEYKHRFGATLVHEESNKIVNAYDLADKPREFKTLKQLCLEKNHNIVVPKIGQDESSIIKLSQALVEDWGYDVHLTLVNLDRFQATIRAVDRFRKSRRYVPLGLIFDGYSSDPILTYYRIKCRHNALFKSLGEVTTDVRPPRCTDCERNNPSNLF